MDAERDMGSGIPTMGNGNADGLDIGAACGNESCESGTEGLTGDAIESGFDDLGTSWQSHVHEYMDSTGMAEGLRERHNHRFAGVSGEAIYVPGSHVHRIETRTDFYDHFHDIRIISGPATFLLDRNARKSDRKHVHFIEGFTSNADHHRHEFEFVTLIEAPLDAEDQSFRD